MRIAVDAFNLGLLQGTGIATYAKELCRMLSKVGHEVFPLYGLRKIDPRFENAWGQFLQRLSIHGEESNRQSLVRDADFLLSVVSSLFSIPLQAKQIKINKNIVDTPLQQRLPVCTKLFNVPYLYQVSQIGSLLTGRQTFVKFPSPIDVLHLTCPLPLKIRGAAKIVTLHDIIPAVLPTSTAMNLKHYLKLTGSAVHDANMIFAVSEHSKNDLIRHFDIPENKVHVTYQSVQIPEQYKNIDSVELGDFLQSHFNLKHKKYFLFYGAIEPKKNVARILEAFSIAKTDYPIVVVGKNGWLHADVDVFFQQHESFRRSKTKKRFIRIPYVSFNMLMRLVKGARGLVFPSLYEGFGLPILEAMELGCPVITSRVSSLPEIGGEAVHYVDPYDINDIASAVNKLSDDESYAETLVQKGYAQAEKFSVDRYLDRLRLGYEKALG